MTPLLAASSEGHLDIVKLLLRCPKTDINMKDASGYTAFDKHHDKDLILQAFERRATLLEGNHTCCMQGNYKLFRAAKTGDDRAIKGLGQCPNVDINIYDRKGRTSLYLSSWLGHSRAVKKMLEVPNIDANKGRYLDGKTPTAIATEKGHFEVMKFLIQSNLANMNKGWFHDIWSSLQKEIMFDTTLKAQDSWRMQTKATTTGK